MSILLGRRRAAMLPLLLLAVSSVDAAQRTFVSTAGNDASATCSLSLPCRGFTKAISVTDPGGEIVVLDSGGYGAVTINQAVTIEAPPGVYAGISVFGGAGVTVNPASGKVTLRGLTINALGGTTGILYQSGDALYVDNVVVSGFSGGGGVGLSVVGGPTPSSLFIQDSTFRDNATGLSAGSLTGLKLRVERTIFERNGIGADLRASTSGTIHDSAFSNGTTGVSAGGGVALELRDCTLSDNSGVGVSALGASPATILAVVSSLISGNATGIQATNSGNTVYSSDNTITRNATGISATASATIISGSDNRLIGNGANGSFTSTTPKI